MALYDEYFRNEDKPFAENLNDALLLSNVFDLTVGVEMPKMFSNSEWVNTTSPRKCSVAICTLKEGLPSGVTVGTDSETGKSILSGTGTVKLSFYPNFNSFGSYDSISWENDGNIVVNLKTAAGITIASNINKGDVESQSAELKTLQEIVIELVFTNATLYSFEVVMSNKEQERYGATVGITDVTGLDDRLSGIDSNLSSLNGVVDDIQANDDFNVSVPIWTGSGAFVEGSVKIYAKNNICHLFANLIINRNVTQGDTAKICDLEWRTAQDDYNFVPIQTVNTLIQTENGKYVNVNTTSSDLRLRNPPALSSGDRLYFSCIYIIGN